MFGLPRRLLCLVACLAVCRAGTAEAQVVIAEFMAANVNTNITDEDGSHSDWIELQNNGVTTVSLNGWYLTDNASDLRKWQFPLTTPAVSLAPGARLLVWASDKNRKVAANRLHTNFKLASEGEYLALLRPDGLTVEYEFGPTYPPQATDVAYGLSGGRQWNVLVGPTLNSQWKVRSPRQADELATGWNSDAAFDSTLWATKTTTVSGGVPKGIGYDSGGSTGTRAFLINYASSAGVVATSADLGVTSGMYNNNGTGPNTFTGTPTLCMRTTFSVADKTQVQGMRINIRYEDGFILYLNGTAILSQNAPASPVWNSAAASDRNDTTIVTYDLTSSLASLNTGTNVLAIHGFNEAKNSANFVITPDFQTQAVSTGTWTTIVGPSLSSQWKVKMPFSATEFTRMAGWNSNTSFNDGAWVAKGTRVSSSVPEGIGYDSTGATGTFRVNYSGSPNGVVTNAADVGLTGLYYTLTSGTDLFSGTPSLAMRATFTVTDPTSISKLRLNIRFDDGFIIYLNGTELWRQNAPTPTNWNSASSADREDDQSEQYTTIELPGGPSYLTAGTNVVAIHALNEGKNSSHFVITPSFEAFQTVAGGGGGAPGYLATPTPGAENTVATTAVGPDISNTVNRPAQPVGGAGSAPLLVTAKLRQTLGAVAGVTCNYVINFGTETVLPMWDDGPAGGHGDATAADGTYSVQLPTTSLSPGHFIRWRIVATDAVGNVSTDPPYRDPYDNDQYYGTMAATPTIQSLVPVLYWFHNSSSTSAVFATNEGGFRSSFYYKLPGAAEGRFFDNVRVTLHGQSTAGFGKKSQNLNFNADNRFEWRNGEKEVRGMNLLSNWADKAHVRNPLAWETWNLTKHPSHWCQTVRVQQITGTSTAGQGNIGSGVDAQFLCLTDMVEDGNSEFLERWGLDADGALYKCYNSLDNTLQNSATQGGGMEKKTREYEDFSDLATLVTVMNPSNSTSVRRQWLYDNVDVPALINYLAVHNLIQSHDFGHKNYYIYRDTNGTREWTLLPWDQDLSFGHRWTSAQGYFDDDLDTGSSIFLGGSGNRVMSIILATGATELAQMYVRRIRTLMDQFYGPSSAPVNYFVTRIDSLQDQIDPPSWPVTTDAERDFQKWGFWVDGSSSVIAYTDSRAADHRARATAIRLKTTNNTVATGGPYPGANPYTAYGSTVNLNSSLNPFIPGRRAFLYNETGLNPSINGQAIPATAQAATPTMILESFNPNPGTAGQDGEYFIIRNPNSVAVDISGWQLAGDVTHTFRAGTVIPAQGTSTSDGTSSAWVNQLVVARKAQGFRARTSSPKALEYRQVQGGYSGQLSARGGNVQLLNATGALVTSQNYSGTPTSAQTALRVTELNYGPVAPTAAESNALAGVKTGDFEFLELTNTGGSALSLGGAQFDKGITFVFPEPYNLAAGARCLIVSNLAAFRLRYGTGLDSIIAGVFEGSLDNAGERLRLLDSVGEEVLDFTYNPAWYPPATAGGYTLVTRVAATAYNGYDNATAWALSATAGGTPGGADTAFSQVFQGWSNDHFTAAELQNTAVSALTADPDLDGKSNFEEYVFAKDPRVADAPTSPVAALVNVGSTDYLSVTIIRPKNALDVSWTVEACGNVTSWQPVNLPVGTPLDLGNGLEQVTFRDSVAAGSGTRFMRVRAQKTL